MDTLTFNPGLNILEPRQYNVSGVITFPTGAIVQGVPGQTILNNLSGPTGYSWYTNNNGVQLRGLSFVGGGVYVDGPNISDLIIDDCEFAIVATQGKKCSIEFETVLTNSSITNNLFTNGSDFQIYSDVGYNTLTLANNEFRTVPAAVHIAATNPSTGLLCEQNYFTADSGMGLELQGMGRNIIVQDNTYEHPVIPTNAGNCMAFSVPMDAGQNITIQRNSIICPERPDGIGTRIGIECGGDNTLVTDNYINGINAAIACTDGNGTCSVTATKNQIINALEQPEQANGGPGRVFIATLNGPDTQLTWDINRGAPGRNRRFPAIGAMPLPVIVSPPIVRSAVYGDFNWDRASISVIMSDSVVQNFDLHVGNNPPVRAIVHLDSKSITLILKDGTKTVVK